MLPHYLGMVIVLESIFYCSLTHRFCHLRPVMTRHHDCLQVQTTAGGHLPPAQLLTHRQAQAFKALCCLCASIEGYQGYTEMAIVSDKGQYVSEYLAECMIKLCEYMGEPYGPFWCLAPIQCDSLAKFPVHLDHMWTRCGLHIRIYLGATPFMWYLHYVNFILYLALKPMDNMDINNMDIIPPASPTTHSVSAIMAYIQVNSEPLCFLSSIFNFLTTKLITDFSWMFSHYTKAANILK